MFSSDHLLFSFQRFYIVQKGEIQGVIVIFQISSSLAAPTKHTMFCNLETVLVKGALMSA